MIIRMKIKQLILFCALLISTTTIHSQIVGLPKISYLSANSPETQIANWAVECDKQGVIYASNDLGVFIYDGVNWIKIFTAPTFSCVRSMKVDQNRIYIGLTDDFGYLTKLSSGTYQYQSLLPKIENQYKKFGNIWNINALGSNVYFQAFEYLFILNNEEITVIKPETIFHNLFIVNNKVILKQFERGLYELSDNELTSIPGSSIFANKDVFGVEPFGKRDMLIFTSRNGIFLSQNNAITIWSSADNGFFAKNPITHAFSNSENQYIVGTANNGFVLMDKTGKISITANKKGGLKSNTIIDIRKDNADNILLATENGIELAELNSTFKYLDERIGLDAKIFDLKLFENRLYTATNQGVFASSYIDPNSVETPITFNAIQNIKEQVWKLDLIDDHLYAMTHTGAFEVKNETLIPLRDNNSEGVWNFAEFKKNPNYLIQGAYNGLNLYKKEAGKLKFMHKIAGFSIGSRNIELDEDDNIWVAHFKLGLFKISLNADMKEAKIMEYFISSDSVTHKIAGLTLINEKLCAIVDGLLYQYDPTSNKFNPMEKLNKTLHAYFPINTISKTKENEYLYIGGNILQEAIGFVNIHNNEYSVKPLPIDKARGKIIHSFEHIAILGETQYALTLSNGILLFDNHFSNNQSQNFNTILSGYQIDNNDSITTLCQKNAPLNNEISLTIPYKFNNILFNYFSTNYNQINSYSSFLEGHENTWSNWQTSKRREFTDLREGSYIFWIKSRNEANEISDVTYFKFIITPPWFRTSYAYFTYLAISILLIIASFKLQQRLIRLKDRKKRYAEILNHRSEWKALQQQQLMAEKEVAELKNDKLQSALLDKNKEATTSAIHVMQLNETLNEIQNQLKPILNQPEGKSKSNFKRVLEQINYKINKTDDWDKFEMHLNQIHQGFLQRLKTEFKDLTTRELRLCGYLRLNLSSKEIAPLLGINYRSVEALRYRTRKKLKLSANQSLTEFIVGY